MEYADLHQKLYNVSVSMDLRNERYEWNNRKLGRI